MSIRAIPYRKHLILPADNRLKIMVPHAKEFMHEGQPMLLIPHEADETAVLRNLGYDVRPPVMMNYDWPTPEGSQPFDAQRITTSLITSNRRSYVLNGMGTGKTRSALYAYDYLNKTTPYYGSALIVCPLATMRQTWEREAAMVFPHLRVAIVHGSKKQRLAALESEAHLFIINHHGVEVVLEELVEMAKRNQIAFGVLDEASIYRNAKSDLWKATHRVVCEIDRVTAMTATPMPLAATDAYGQLKMMTPAVLRGQSFTRFREEVQNKVSQFRWVNKRNAVEDVYKLMQPAVRFTRDECYDMPECQMVTWKAEMSKQALTDFREMADMESIKREGIAAANAADKINKLLQISLGTVYRPDHTELDYDISSRMDLLETAIEQSNSKVIVFTPYKSTLRRLKAEVAKRWSVAEVSGDVSPSQRERIFTSFMHSPDPQVLVAHPECMSHGLTLTEASTIVWWGPPNSLETYEQANGRITRAGQRHSQLIVNLVATKLEEQIFKLLERRANVQQSLLQMFEQQDQGDLS